MVDGQRPDAGFQGRYSAQRDLFVVGSLDVEQRQRRRVGLIFRRDFHNHKVLIARRVDRRYLPLRVGAIKRALELIGGDAERLRFVAIHIDGDLRAGDLQVCGHILQAR